MTVILLIVSKTRPPNFEDIAIVFPQIKTQKGILYCYEDVIHNPDDVEVTPYLGAHEETHMHQQLDIGSAKTWWDKYLEDISFRFSQELQAHIIEYSSTYKIRDREKRARYLVNAAQRLSSSLYGNMCNYTEALKLIRNK